MAFSSQALVGNKGRQERRMKGQGQTMDRSPRGESGQKVEAKGSEIKRSSTQWGPSFTGTI